ERFTRATYFTPRIFFTAFTSTLATGWSLPKSRLRFDDFFVRLWLFIACRRISLPAPVTLNRFFAPLPVFTFGMSHHCVLRRAEHHDHVPPVERRLLLDLPELLHVGGETLEKSPTPLRMEVLPPPEHDRDLDLRPLVQEPDDMALLGLVVVVADLRSELDLLDVDRRLVLSRLLRALLLLVAPLAVVHDARHGRVGLFRHLDEIEILRVRVLERLFRVLDPDLLPVLADEPHPRYADLLVDPILLDDGTRPVLGTTPWSQRQFTKSSRSSSFRGAAVACSGGIPSSVSTRLNPARPVAGEVRGDAAP